MRSATRYSAQTPPRSTVCEVRVIFHVVMQLHTAPDEARKRRLKRAC
jgi:hypothetical protein